MRTLQKDDVVAAAFLISRGASLIFQDLWGRSPLFYALRSLPLVTLLLEKGANINTIDIYKQTLLHYAILHEPLAIPMLIKVSFNFNFIRITLMLMR